MNHERDLRIYGDNDMCSEPDDKIRRVFLTLFLEVGKEKTPLYTKADSGFEALESDGQPSDDEIMGIIDKLVDSPISYLWDIGARYLYNASFNKSMNTRDMSDKYHFEDVNVAITDTDPDAERIWLLPFVIPELRAIPQIRRIEQNRLYKTVRCYSPETPKISRLTDFCGFTIQALFKDLYSLRLFSAVSSESGLRKGALHSFKRLVYAFYKVGNEEPDAIEYYEMMLSDDDQAMDDRGLQFMVYQFSDEMPFAKNWEHTIIEKLREELDEDETRYEAEMTKIQELQNEKIELEKKKAQHEKAGDLLSAEKTAKKIDKVDNRIKKVKIPKRVNPFPITICDQWLIEKVTGANVILELFPACLVDFKMASGIEHDQILMNRYFEWIDVLLGCRPVYIRVQLAHLVSVLIKNTHWDLDYSRDDYDEQHRRFIEYVKVRIERANRMYAQGAAVYDGKQIVCRMMPDLRVPGDIFLTAGGYSRTKKIFPPSRKNKDTSKKTNPNYLFNNLLYHALVKSYDINGLSRNYTDIYDPFYPDSANSAQ